LRSRLKEWGARGARRPGFGRMAAWLSGLKPDLRLAADLWLKPDLRVVAERRQSLLAPEHNRLQEGCDALEFFGICGIWG